MNDYSQQISSSPISGHMAALNCLKDLKPQEDIRVNAKELGLAKFAQLPEARKREAIARQMILDRMNSFIKAGGFKRNKGISLFCKMYNGEKIDLPEGTRKTLSNIRKLYRATLFRWEAAYRERGLFGLASSYGHRKGATKLTDEQKKFVISLIVEHPDVLIPTIRAALEARFVPQGISVPASHVVRSFVKKYRRDNKSLLLFMKNPDAWKSKYQFAVGNASENIIRLNQLWETDATPADVMLSDGRHTVIANIDVFSRKAKIIVTPTSKAQAIGMLFRRCIIDWGVPEILRSDNGKDFTSHHIESVLEALEVEQDLCPPFTPEAKPHIERFIHTFSHGIVELLPGFLGHNVAERKNIEARKSFAQRFMKKGAVVEIKLTALEFQEICDRWLTAFYMQNPHSGLGGKTPEEVGRSWTDPVRRINDERALDVLLCPAAEDGGWRVVGKKGVRAERRVYVSTAMAGHEGHRVKVLLDYTDLGKAFIFEENGAFLCMATCPDWSGISAQDKACYLRNAQKKLISEKRRELKQVAKEQRIGIVPEQILSYRESLIENIKEIPRKTETYTTSAIQEAILAADQRDGIVNKEALAGPLAIPPEVIAYEEEQKKVVNLQQKRREKQMLADNWGIYTWILDCTKEKNATDLQKQWKKEYENWQDSGMRKPFSSSISLESLTGETETGGVL